MKLRSLLPALAVLPVLPLLLASPPAPAQAPAEDAETRTIVVDLFRHGASKTPLAVPLPEGASDQAREFHAILMRDLELCGWFDLIDPKAFVEPAEAGLRPGSFRFEDWEVPGASGLAKTSLGASDAGGVRAEVWVYDVPGRRKIGARAYSAGRENVRTLAHKVANEIILQITGQPGPFNTRFAVSAQLGGNKEIAVIDFDGHGLVPVTKNGSINLQPAWDPSGRRIAFTSYMGGNPDLYVADLGAGRITRVSARPGINTGASWHPGGGLLALTLSPGGDSDIYTVDAASGKEVARITRSLGIDVSPAFSPDGGRIAFVSERSGGAQIYVAGADGSAPRRVTFQGSYNTDPAWSPDGKTLAFVGRDGNFDVFTVEVDTGRTTRLTQGAGDNEDPSWSPDGRFVAFSSTRAGGSHIWMSTANGAHQVQLTSGKGGYTSPAWSPALAW